MKWKSIILFGALVILGTIMINADFGYNNLGVPQLPPNLNYSDILANLSLNSSDYWDNLDTPADILFSDLGCSSIDISGCNGDITADDGTLAYLTINQKADSNGIRIYGYDDVSGYYGDLEVDASGYMNIQAVRGYRFYQSSNLVAFIDGTSSNGFRAYDNIPFSMGGLPAERWSLLKNATNDDLELWRNGVYVLSIDDVNFNINHSANITAKWFDGNFTWTVGDDWATFDGREWLFNESMLATIYYNATQSAIYGGTVDGGTLSDTQHQDGHYDGVSFNFTEQAPAPALDLRMNFTNIETFNAGVMRYKTSSLAGDRPIIQVWDYDEGAWEDYPTISESENWAIIQQSVFDSTDHVGTGANDGVVQMRIYKASNGNTNNHYYVDWVAIAKGYGTPAGEETDPIWNSDKQNYLNSSDIRTEFLNSSQTRSEFLNLSGTNADRNLYINDYNLTAGYVGVGDLAEPEYPFHLNTTQLNAFTIEQEVGDGGFTVGTTFNMLLDQDILIPVAPQTHKVFTTTVYVDSSGIGSGGNNINGYTLTFDEDNKGDQDGGNLAVDGYTFIVYTPDVELGASGEAIQSYDANTISLDQIITNGGGASEFTLIENGLVNAFSPLGFGVGADDFSGDAFVTYVGSSFSDGLVSNYDTGTVSLTYNGFITSFNNVNNYGAGTISGSKTGFSALGGGTKTNSGGGTNSVTRTAFYGGSNFDYAFNSLSGDVQVQDNITLDADGGKMWFGEDKDAWLEWDGTNFNFNQTGNGIWTFWNSSGLGGIRYQTAYTSTEVNNDTNALETINLGNDLYNPDGSINHTAFGDCYVQLPTKNLDDCWEETDFIEYCYWINYTDTNSYECYNEVLNDYRIINETIINHTYTECSTYLEDGVDLTCEQAKTRQILGLLNHNMNIYDNITDFDTGIMAEDYFTQSQVISTQTTYTDYFEDKNLLADKSTHYAYVEKEIDGTTYELLSVEDRIVALEGAVAELLDRVEELEATCIRK